MTLRLFVTILLTSLSSSQSNRFVVQRLKTEVVCNANTGCDVLSPEKLRETLLNEGKRFQVYANSEIAKLRASREDSTDSTTGTIKTDVKPETSTSPSNFSQTQQTAENATTFSTPAILTNNATSGPLVATSSGKIVTADMTTTTPEMTPLGMGESTSSSSTATNILNTTTCPLTSLSQQPEQTTSYTSTPEAPTVESITNMGAGATSAGISMYATTDENLSSTDPKTSTMDSSTATSTESLITPHTSTSDRIETSFSTSNSTATLTMNTSSGDAINTSQTQSGPETTTYGDLTTSSSETSKTTTMTSSTDDTTSFNPSTTSDVFRTSVTKGLTTFEASTSENPKTQYSVTAQAYTGTTQIAEYSGSGPTHGSTNFESSTTTVECRANEEPYNGKCYFDIMKHGDFGELALICKMFGGKPADIVDEEHFEKVVEYYRDKIPNNTSSFIRVLLGTTEETVGNLLMFADWRSTSDRFTTHKPRLVLRVPGAGPAQLDTVSEADLLRNLLCVRDPMASVTSQSMNEYTSHDISTADKHSTYDMTSTTPGTSNKATTHPEDATISNSYGITDNGTDELSYMGKRYFKIIQEGNFTKLNASCVNQGGVAANIVDEIHYNQVLEYFQGDVKPPIGDMPPLIKIMLGTTNRTMGSMYTPAASNVILSSLNIEVENNKITTFTTTRKHLVLVVLQSDYTGSGTYTAPANELADGVFCVKSFT